MSKFAVVFFGGFIVSMGSIFWTMKSTYIFRSVVHTDLREPDFPALIPKNTFVATGVGARHFDISAVLGPSAFSEILPSVIQGVVVLMIAFLLSFFAAKNHAMHVQSSWIWIALATFAAANSIETSSIWTPPREPIPLIQPLEIFGIDNRGLSLSQGNKSVRLVQRLSNGMPLLRLSGHWSSMKGLMLLNRILA